MLKTINYRGGVIRFRIPSNWSGEYEEAGGGTFYKPGDQTGTLRVNVITGEGPPGKVVTVDRLTELLRDDCKKHGVDSIPLGDSAVMIRFDMPGEERGQPLKNRCWRIFQALPPVSFRHVLITYTLLPEQFDRPEFREEMEMLKHEITAIQFAPVLGEVAPPKKPWWRPW
jgi:hypothetical protein